MGEDTRQPGLEEGFHKLEEILQRLEDDSLPLEDAFAAYSEGMTVLKQCSEQIDRVEKQVLRLGGDGQLEEFGDGKSGI